MFRKRSLPIVLFLLSAILLASCSGGTATESDTKIRIGTTGGTFNFLLKRAIVPVMKDNGYTVEFFPYTDEEEINEHLISGEIDANLFQTRSYLERVKEDTNAQIEELAPVPTAPLGLYSMKYTSTDEIEEGAVLTLPADSLHMPAALSMLEKIGLLTIDPEVDKTRATESDIIENPKKIKIQPISFRQITIAPNSAELTVMPTNLAEASHVLDEETGILEIASAETDDEFLDIIAIPSSNAEEPFAKALKKALASDEFKEYMESDVYYVKKEKE